MATAGAFDPWTDLNIGSPATDSWANGVNNHGDIVGGFVPDSSSHAYLLAADGTFTDLTPTNDESQAYDINDAGTIVGQLKNASAEYRAFIRPAGGPVQELGTLGGTYSIANAINASGFVVGYSLNAANRGRAMSYDPATSTMTDLGTLGGDYSEANDVNDAGFIVGGARPTGSTNLHAFVIDPGTHVMTDLGTLGGDSSRANGINNRGQIVGEAQVVGGDYHAFVYDLATHTMTDLGLTSTYSSAKSINDRGIIVGQSQATSGGHAFVVDLAAADPSPVDLGTIGGPYSYASDVSGQNLVVGSSSINDVDELSHATKIQLPLPEAPTTTVTPTTTAPATPATDPPPATPVTVTPTYTG